MEHITSLSPSAGFFLLLTAGLLTGLSHCAGMCGPLVSAFALRRRAARQEVAAPLAMFQLGRLTTYALLGAAMGAVGGVVNVAAALRGWQGVLSVGLGAAMVALGLGLMGGLPARRLESAALARAVTRRIGRLLTAEHPAAPFGLGLANGLLPCGPVYAMSLLAAATGNPARGALAMFVFGLGTLPAMLGIGLSASALGARLRRGLFRAAALLVVLVGLQLALRGLAMNGLIAHTHLGGVMLW
ncbi:MAG: sulfite exporter TauE/SafE family protein [Caldilineae bacterium]|nr:MAG: sulfite exporter TauE/SafE family protein [Caldilineae bacterium]